METSGFNEILHFTDSPEIQSFYEVKFNKNDNVYGVSWANVVREYLMTAYSEKNDQAEVVSGGVRYKVLKRGEVTVFYDAAGNTLFDVENKRLEKEYGFVMNGGTETALDKDDQKEENNEIHVGEGSSKEEDAELPVPITKVEDSRPVKERAVEKLEKELKAAKDKIFAEPVIGYLLKRCKEDEGLSQDVVQEHKTWKKCFEYVYEQARRQATGNIAAVRDDVVFEWAEDYYHKDDKAEEEKKAKREAEAKAKREKAKEEKKVSSKMKSSKNATNTSSVNGKTNDHTKDGNSPKYPKPNKNGKDIDGQMDLFSMLGI